MHTLEYAIVSFTFLLYFIIEIDQVEDETRLQPS